MSPDSEGALRLLGAAASGALLGIPTSVRGRFGGLRTHALVAMGAALFCLVVRRHAPEEVGRVVAAVATGVGFIGAAAVIKRRGYILGLSSAASIWLAAGVGCSAALGDWWPTVAVAALVTTADSLLLLVRKRLFPRGPLRPPGDRAGRPTGSSR